MTTPEAALAAALSTMPTSQWMGGHTADILAPHVLAALHEAGWVLTPLAPEVSPRRDGVREALLRSAVRYHSVAEGHHRFYTFDAIDDAVAACPEPECVEARNALLAAAYPEPPDSGDGAAGLTEAWTEAEEAFPEGWVFWGLTGYHEGHGGGPAKVYARLRLDHGIAVGNEVSASGSTPAAALHALAARLRAAAPAEAREEGPDA